MLNIMQSPARLCIPKDDLPLIKNSNLNPFEIINKSNCLPLHKGKASFEYSSKILTKTFY